MDNRTWCTSNKYKSPTKEGNSVICITWTNLEVALLVEIILLTRPNVALLHLYKTPKINTWDHRVKGEAINNQ